MNNNDAITDARCKDCTHAVKNSRGECEACKLLSGLDLKPGRIVASKTAFDRGDFYCALGRKIGD